LELTKSDINKAYLFLKSYAHHENLNLFLKQRVASFEVTGFEHALTDLVYFLNEDNWQKNINFSKWLGDINYHLLPKAINRPEDSSQNEHNKKNGLFISNRRDSKNYQVSKVNYFINAPVELHIIEILWCIVVGPALESELSGDCYGNRMDSSAMSYFDDTAKKETNPLFKRYIEQYNKWRDQSIDEATDISKKGEDVALLSLDLKSYFYHVNLNFDQMREVIKSFFPKDGARLALALKLTQILELIFKKYNKKISLRLSETHNECIDKQGLPIGFAASSIISNWYLADFDKAIADKVRPAYYGRYVDDIIIVFKRPKLDDKNPIGKFINEYMNGLLGHPSRDDNYNIKVGQNELPLQKDKLILQYFDKNHSRAGLEIFKQELNERSSAFKFLPSDHIDKELDKFAYDVLYDGSANKLRSVVGLAENETELAKYLSSHITAHRLCKFNKNDTVLPELDHFFKGQNALQFNRLWEKIFQYTLITKQYEFISNFSNYLNCEIDKINGSIDDVAMIPNDLSIEVRRDLHLYNDLSLAITIGLLDINDPNPTSIGCRGVFQSKKNIQKLGIKFGSKIHHFSWDFRASNLIRHHLVAWPLANYSAYKGDLTDEENFISESDFTLVDNKLDLSPRFIHFDEWQLFKISSYLNPDKDLNQWFDSSLNDYKERSFSQEFPIEYKKLAKPNENVAISKHSIGTLESRNKLRLAIANLVVNEEDIETALRKDKKPNVSFERQKNLYQILNSAIKEKADILVMPEVSVPVSWLPFMIAFARRHQIAIVFGLEHWVVNNVAYNLIIEALPFKISKKYKSCAVIARLKNHYAPNELALINRFRLKTPRDASTSPDSLYHKVSWRGTTFTTYNCFELSDITHRVLFRSEIDLLFACVWNKDTNYYQHILESTVRDLHCYTVQSNTSQHGGSCVLRPTKTENKTMLYVKGGGNASVLTTDIDIATLRDFQFKSTPKDNDIFKHLPPGYDSESVIER